jgi:hypothetical protein
MPVLVVSGAREPAPYRRRAEDVAAGAPDGELLVIDDDHYYRRDPDQLTAAVLDWVDRRQIFGAAPLAPSGGTERTAGR